MSDSKADQSSYDAPSDVAAPLPRAVPVDQDGMTGADADDLVSDARALLAEADLTVASAHAWHSQHAGALLAELKEGEGKADDENAACGTDDGTAGESSNRMDAAGAAADADADATLARARLGSARAVGVAAVPDLMARTAAGAPLGVKDAATLRDDAIVRPRGNDGSCSSWACSLLHTQRDLRNASNPPPAPPTHRIPVYAEHSCRCVGSAAVGRAGHRSRHV
jgi:hypothetical protein